MTDSVSTYRSEEQCYQSRYTQDWFQDTTEQFITFISYLSQHCAVGKDEPANLIVIDKNIRCNIESDKVYDIFYRYEKCRLAGIKLYVCEKPLSGDDHKGIMMDFDIYQKASISLIENTSICTELIKVYFTHLKKYINLFKETEDLDLHLFVTKRPQPPKIDIQKQVYRDGFHILIPEIMIQKHVQQAILISAMADMRTVFKDMFADNILNIESTEEYGDLIDTACTYVPYVLLGGDKIGNLGKKCISADIKYIYKITLDDSDNNCRIMDVTNSIKRRRYNMSYECSLIHNHSGIQYKPLTTKRKYSPTNESMIKAMLSKGRSVTAGEVDEFELFDKDISMKSINDPTIRTVSELSDMLSIKRMTDYDTRIRYTLLMASISKKYNGGDDYKSIAIKTWMKGEKYKTHVTEFNNLWQRGLSDGNTTRKYNIGTLYWWANEDNPVKYMEWLTQNLDVTIKKICLQNAGKINHAQVACIVYSMFSHKYKYNIHYNKTDKNISDGPWFEFITDKDHQAHPLWHFKYMPCETPSSLEEYISRTLPSVIKKYADIIKNDMEKCSMEEKGKKDMLNKIYKNLVSSIYYFGISAYVKGCIDMCKKAFRDEQLYEKINSVKYLLPVQNGILDVNPINRKNGKFRVHLIQDKHDYFVSAVVGVPYQPYEEMLPVINEIRERIINTFIPEPDMQEYFLYFLSTAISDGVKDLILMQLVGGGENGKSVVMKLFEQSLSGFIEPCDASVLSHITDDPGKHSSHIAVFNYKRMLRFNESEPNTQVAQSSIKKLLSGEAIPYRESHGRQSKMNLVCNMIATTNFSLLIPVNDHGTWRRLQHYECKTKFVHGRPREPNEVRADPSIEDFVNDKRTHIAFLSLLVHYYEKLHNEYGGSLKNLRPNEFPTIYQETQNYRNTQDHINNFIFKRMLWSPSSEGHSITDIAIAYKRWYETRIGTQCKYTINNIAKLFDSSRLKKYIKVCPNGDHLVTNHRLIRDDDDEPDDDEMYMHVYDMMMSKVVDISSDEEDEEEDDEDWPDCLYGSMYDIYNTDIENSDYDIEYLYE